MRSGFNLSIILILSLIFHALYWIGYGMGDDRLYANMIREIMAGCYRLYPVGPESGNFAVFQFRPLLLLSTALSSAILGFNDIGFVFPIFISHLLSIIIIYFLAGKLFNEAAGIIAALLLAAFPLRLVFATTLSNDILLAVLQAGAVLLVIQWGEGKRGNSILTCATAGILLGLGQAVKSYSIIMLFILSTYILFARWRVDNARKGATALLAGWAAVMIVCIALFRAGGAGWGDFFTAEMKYNLWITPPEKFQNGAQLLDHLLFYPRMMFNQMCLMPTGFSPYGYFYWLVSAALLYTVTTRRKNYVIVAYWAVLLFVFMEFAPLRIFPYQPIHRLERTLDIITIPAVLLCAGFLSELLRKNVWFKTAAVAIMVFLITSSLWTGIPYVMFRRDAMLDMKECSVFLGKQKNGTVYTDEELFWGASFYMPSNDVNRMKWVYLENLHRAAGSIPWEKFEQGSLVVLGGARRPDFYFGALSRFEPHAIPQNWKLVQEYKHEQKPWRKKPLRVYVIL
jgi:4-amino-4-deoxy-L-arabinose transferase-like glycosyltransferase